MLPLFFWLFAFVQQANGDPLSLEKEKLLEQIQSVHAYPPAQFTKLKHLMMSSPYLGQGNPKATSHPVSRETCLAKIEPEKNYTNPEFEKTCQAKYMAPLGEGRCIDQFEFPNIPCEYPVVWVQANEAAAICQAIGKRLCDASEWEGACAGDALQERYRLAETKTSIQAAHSRQKTELNRVRKQKWAYGPMQNHNLCATDSDKSSACNRALETGKGVWESCGSNTYPAGYFPACKSSFQVYDQHGNVAEHMNLPLYPHELTREGKSGYVEMKGSWFIFQKYSAHPDDCYWRAPYWHGTALMHTKSHRNYHLGFRCCKG